VAHCAGGGARLDGCYVIKTDLPASAASTQTVHDRYKELSLVEQAFRTCKTALRANIDETVLLVVITEQGENRNQCEEQWISFGFAHGFACCGT